MLSSSDHSTTLVSQRPVATVPAVAIRVSKIEGVVVLVSQADQVRHLLAIVSSQVPRVVAIIEIP
jgi:hypothetical protein